MSRSYKEHPSPIYRKEFLLGELYRAAVRCPTPQSFADFHAQALGRIVPEFHCDLITTNLYRVEGAFKPDPNVVSYAAHVSDGLGDLTMSRIHDPYMKWGMHDTFSTQAVPAFGSAFFTEAVGLRQWENSVISIEHCQPLRINAVFTISYGVPFHRTAILTFYGMLGGNRQFPVDLIEADLEYLWYPFYLGWLHRYERICADTLKEWLESLVDMTLPRFELVRALAGDPEFSVAAVAAQRGVAPNTVYKQIEGAFKRAFPLKGDSPGGNANRMLLLAKKYRFFELGPASIHRELPLR